MQYLLPKGEIKGKKRKGTVYGSVGTENRMGQGLSRKIKQLARLGPDAEGDGLTEHLETRIGAGQVREFRPISMLRVARLFQ